MTFARQSALGLFFFFALPLAVGGCGPQQPPTEDPATAKPKALDHTEVTMEVSSFDAAAPGDTSSSTASTTSTATPVATSTGPDVTADPFFGGKQDQPAVETAVAAIRPRLRVCYKKGVAGDPSFTGGSATFDATIGKEGKVRDVRFVKRNGLNEDMVSCLLPVLKSMTFDGNQKSQVMTLTFGSAPAAASTTTPAAAADAGAKK